MSALVSEIMTKMISEANGNIHDIDHFIKVYTYAKTIGEGERLDARTQEILELAAIVHDISCPLCREKYGNTNGKYQEAESPALVRAFFSGTAVPADEVERIVSLVSRHHTYTGVDGPDMRILLEADYIVNASEKGYAPAALRAAEKTVFETATGLSLLHAVFCLA